MADTDAMRWKVGDEVIVTPDANRQGGGRFTVTRVGRKWITISGWRERRFDLASGREDSDGCGGYCYAYTLADYAVVERRNAAIARADPFVIGWTWHARLTVEEIETIASIFEGARDRKDAR